MRLELIAGRMLLGLALWMVVGLQGADPGSGGKEAVRRQAAEVERLQSELRRAQAELDRLQEVKAAQTNSALVDELSSAGDLPVAEAIAPKGPEAGSRGSDRAPMQETDVVEGDRLAAEFAADAEGAGTRYAKRTFRVCGEIVGFRCPMARRVYELELGTQQATVDLTCRFNYIDVYRTVYARDKERELVGVTEGRAIQPLFRRGQRVTILGRCQGLKQGEIRMTGCVLVE
jgi:hypothetical protein